MSELFYDFIIYTAMLLLMLLAAHYVYLEPFFVRRRSFWIFFIFYLVCLTTVMICPKINLAEGFLPLFFCGIYILCVRKEHKLRGFFMFIPIMGICTGIFMPFIIIPNLLAPASIIKILDYATDILTILFLLVFAWKGNRWREKFAVQMQYRKLERWEKRLLNSTGTFLFLIAAFLVEDESGDTIPFYFRVCLGLSSIIAMYLTIVVIALIIQGNKKSYYQSAAAFNEYYLQQQLNHFKAYQETQMETRRMRHDMKNHLHCLRHLAEQGKLPELTAYLNDIDGELNEINAGIHCGNEMVDIVCNEKFQLAQQYGIHLEVEGRLPAEGFLSPLDTCTIFANALDNAIEAVQNLEGDKKWITVRFSGQGNMMLLQFKNPLDKPPSPIIPGKTTKKDYINHGFGLQNISMTAKKYQGQMNLYTEQQGCQTVFVLEVCCILN